MNKLDISIYYNTIAPSYNYLYREEQLKKYRISLNRSLINLDEIVNIVDIGIGTSLLPKYLEEELKIKDLYVIGLDISIELIKRSLKPKHILIDYILADGEELPLRNSKIDLITLYTVIHHFNKPLRFIERLLNMRVRNLIISFLGFDMHKIYGFVSERFRKMHDKIYHIEYRIYSKREYILILTLNQ